MDALQTSINILRVVIRIKGFSNDLRLIFQISDAFSGHAESAGRVSVGNKAKDPCLNFELSSTESNMQGFFFKVQSAKSKNSWVSTYRESTDSIQIILILNIL